MLSSDLHFSHGGFIVPGLIVVGLQFSSCTMRPPTTKSCQHVSSTTNIGDLDKSLMSRSMLASCRDKSSFCLFFESVSITTGRVWKTALTVPHFLFNCRSSSCRSSSGSCLAFGACLKFCRVSTQCTSRGRLLNLLFCCCSCTSAHSLSTLSLVKLREDLK